MSAALRSLFNISHSCFKDFRTKLGMSLVGVPLLTFSSAHYTALRTRVCCRLLKLQQSSKLSGIWENATWAEHVVPGIDDEGPQHFAEYCIHKVFLGMPLVLFSKKILVVVDDNYGQIDSFF